MTGSTERCIGILRLADESASEDVRKELPPGWDDPATLQLIHDSGDAVQAEYRSKWAQVAELREPKLRWLAALLGFCFFCLSFSWSGLFYWFMEYLKLLGAEDAVVPVMLAAPFGKMLAVVILLAPFVPGRCLVDTAPRTLLMKTGYFGCAFCTALLCVTTNVMALAAIMFVCQVFEGFVWQSSAIYVAEAFPTTVRNGGMGLCWLIGSLGGITNAAVAGELMEIWVYLPMTASAILLCAGGAASFLLTEERGKSPLTDTVLKSARDYGTCDAKSV